MKASLKKNKQVLVAGLVLIALVVLYAKRDSIRNFFRKSDKMPSSYAANTTNFIPVNTSNDTILKKGSTGGQVRQLQQLLNEKHRNNKPQIIPLLVEDGNFGPKTEAMLKKWTGKTTISINQLVKDLQ
ncbi:peptidoglycan-binding protein [Aureispira sp. CCB-QB1]|uniref:peptidoglycan-binding domain-containing protein n=1 Tax=Aureispira sp. CCB-QB1 TaxID=1313421 RepID=UPI0006982DC5|nr:hypothetical protein [Aureispira sp. CCB-QB1]